MPLPYLVVLRSLLMEREALSLWAMWVSLPGHLLQVIFQDEFVNMMYIYMYIYMYAHFIYVTLTGSSITVATGTIGEILKTGVQEINTPNAQGCATNRLTAITSGSAATCTSTVVSVLDGLTLTPGKYCFLTFSLNAGATVTLDGTGVESPQWVFVAGTTFITGIYGYIYVYVYIYMYIFIHIYI
jgi:hypothetical protein